MVSYYYSARKRQVLLNYNSNELYVKRGKVGKNTRKRVLIITE